jgi:hypothetical protein
MFWWGGQLTDPARHHATTDRRLMKTSYVVCVLWGYRRPSRLAVCMGTVPRLAHYSW